MEIKYNGKIFKSGQRVKGTINNGAQITGMLYFSGHTWYFLHNSQSHCGSTPDNMFNYQFSWAFHDQGSYLSDNVNLIDTNENSKEYFHIQYQLNKFLTDRINIEYLDRKNVVKHASQIYSLYTSDESKYGFVKFLNEKGSVTEMKFGRFLMCYITDVKKHYDVDLTLDAKTIEKLHNEYITHQKETNLQVEFLKGEDILKAYTRDNYHENDGRLSGSCMTDRHQYLKLYTQNDCVQLLCIKMDGKYVGRALVWETEKGKYLDSIYTTKDWVYAMFNYVKADKGYLVASTEDEVRISVNTDGIDQFPYLDTFMYLSPDGKTLYNHNNNRPDHKAHDHETKVLRSTDGSYDVIRNNNNVEIENNDPF